MYGNLKAELTRFGIKNSDLAELWNVTEGTASLKINGKTIVKLEEAFAIQDYLFEKSGKRFAIEELFKK